MLEGGTGPRGGGVKGNGINSWCLPHIQWNKTSDTLNEVIAAMQLDPSQTTTPASSDFAYNRTQDARPTPSQ